jgi:hypothetical protein
MERKYLKTCLMFCGGSSYAEWLRSCPACGRDTDCVGVSRYARWDLVSARSRRRPRGIAVRRGSAPLLPGMGCRPCTLPEFGLRWFLFAGLPPLHPHFSGTSAPAFLESIFFGALPFDTLHFGLGFRAFANVSLGWSLIDSVNTRPLVGRNSTACP